MHPILEERKADLDRLCALYGVKRLEVFGSVLTDRFDPEKSDIDFLVDLEPAPPGVIADRFLGLLVELEDLFGRRIDLVMAKGIKNPYFLEEIEETRKLLYAA